MSLWKTWLHLQNIARFTSGPFMRAWWVGWFIVAATLTVFDVLNGFWVPAALTGFWTLVYGWYAWPTMLGRQSSTWRRGPFRKGQRVRVFKNSLAYEVVGDREMILDDPPRNGRSFWIARTVDGKPVHDTVSGAEDTMPLWFGEFARSEVMEENNEEV